jgi:hypothetical protein
VNGHKIGYLRMGAFAIGGANQCYAEDLAARFFGASFQTVEAGN